MKNLRNVTFEENKGILGQILMDFLCFYGKNFNYLNTVITPRSGINQSYPYSLSVALFNIFFVSIIFE